MRAFHGFQVDIELQDLLWEEKYDGTTSCEEARRFAHSQNAMAVNSVERLGDAPGVTTADKWNLAKCEFRSLSYLDQFNPMTANIDRARTLRQRTAERKTAVTANQEGGIGWRKNTGGPFDETRKMSKKSRLSAVFGRGGRLRKQVQRGND
jgi:hypothetical protein